MKNRLASLSLISVLLLILAPMAIASTTWYVDGVHGNDSNDCKTRQTACKTIGHAISLASAGDIIGVGPAVYYENLTISISLKVIGSGARTTIIDGGAVARVLTISGALADVSLSRLTIQNGFDQHDGGGINNNGILTISNIDISGNVAGRISGGAGRGGGTGGGIFNSGTLTINTSTVSGNQARGNIENGGHGGGISNFGTITINQSTISGNSVANFGEGGGIDNYGILTINNSTISANSGYLSGGGILNSGAVTISNSTLVGNYIHFLDNGGGGGISGPATLQNSIVADNYGGNCSSTLTSDGYNLSSDNSCNLTGPGDMNNIDPLLGPLQNNGGPTETMAEITGSPTIDAGNPNGCTNSNGQLLKIDQRGFPRPGKDKHDHRCDMGAYESQSD